MKKLQLKLFMFLVGLFLIIQLMRSLSIPFYSQYNLASKYKYLETQADAYNTIVIGSSHIDRHFIPSIFDSITGLHSFNMGQAGAMMLENMYNIDYIIEKNIVPNLKFILFQTTGDLNQLNQQKLRVVKDRYYVDTERYWIALKTFIASRDFTQVGLYTRQYVYNLLGVSQLKKFFVGNQKKATDWIGPRQGYNKYGPNSQGNTPEFGRQYIKKKGTYYMEGHQYKSPDRVPNIKRSDEIISEALEDIHDQCKRHGIELILLVQPNENLHRKIAKIPSIYLGDGYDYPTYFDVRNRANFKHLNHKGAQEYSRRIGERFQEQVLPKK